MRTRRGRRLGRGWRARLGFGVAMAVGAVTLPGCARAPSVATIDPAAGPTTGGTTVTVTGTVFKDVRQVRFGEVDAEFTVRSETEIEVVAPPGDEGSVRVTVVTASGTSAPETAPVFTYLPEAEPGPDTVVVGDEDVVDVAANDGTGGGTLTLAADATAPDMGSIVSSAAGTGLIGRVTSVVEEPGGLVVETGSVALAEAFPSGAFDTNVSSGDAGAPGAGASGAEAMPGGGAGDAAGSPSRGAAAVGDLHCGSTVVEGSATLDAADFDLDVHAAWGPLVTDELSVTGSISVTGTVAVSGQLTGDCWITLLGPAFGPPVPVVPGVLTLTSVFRGKLNLDADIDIVGASATVTASGRVGVGWNEKRGLHPIVDLDPPDVDVDTSSLLSRGFVGTGRAAIGGDVTILVNALLGPSVFIGPYLEIDADTQRNPWLKVNGGLLVSASFTLNLWFVQLDWQLVEAELLERAVFTAPGGWSGPRITDTAAPPGRLDQPYAWSVGASGGAAPLTWSVTDGSLPAGLSLATNGTISGRPGADGTRTLTLQATDAAGRAARQRFSLRVDGIEIVGGPPAAPYAEPYAAQLSAVGGRTPYSWTVASGSLPPGIGLSGSGALAGESDQPGSYSATVRVTDAGGRSASRSLTLTVLPPEPEVLPLATAQYALPLEDGTLALVVNEQEQNEDRNGDGDLFDAVITLRLPDGSLRNTGVPMASTSSWPELPVALPGGGMMGVSQYVAGDGSGEVFWLDAAHQAHYVDSVREPVLLEDGSFLVCPLTADGQGTELRRVTRDGGPGEPMMTFASTFGCGDVVPLADGGYAFSAPATPGEDPGAVDTVSVWWITRPGSAPVATPLLTPGVALPTAGGSLLVWASDTHWSSEGGWYHVSPDLTITNLNIDESGRAGLADQPYVAADDTGAALVGVSELGDPTDSDDDRDLNHDGDAVDLVRWLVRPDGSTLQLPWASGGEWSARGLADGFGFWTEVPGSDTGAFRVVDSEGALAATLPGWDVKATGRSGFTAIQTEADLGADLTGDGDQADLSPVLYAPPYGPAPSGLASDNGYLITYEAWGLHDGGMSFMAWESPEGGDKGSGTGRDLNGDGDTTDVLPTVVDPGGRVTVWPDPNTRIQAPLPGGGFVGHTYETFDDLNGDGDTNDQVLNLTDGDGHAVNLGVAGWVPTHGRSADCRFPCAYDGWSWTIRQPAPVLASGDLVLIASERANMQDYNGDGDRLDFSPLLVGV